MEANVNFLFRSELRAGNAVLAVFKKVMAPLVTLSLQMTTSENDVQILRGELQISVPRDVHISSVSFWKGFQLGMDRFQPDYNTWIIRVVV